MQLLPVVRWRSRVTSLTNKDRGDPLRSLQSCVQGSPACRSTCLIGYCVTRGWVSCAPHHGEAWPQGHQQEHRDASAGRWKAVALPLSATLGCLMAGCGRTGAVGWTPRVARSSSGHSHAAQPESTKSLCEVHRRMMTRIGAPQVGQRATRGVGGWRLGRGHRWGVPARSAGGWSREGWHSWHGESRSGGLS